MARAQLTEPVPAPTSQTVCSGATSIRATARVRTASLVMGTLPRWSWLSKRLGAPQRQARGAGLSTSITAKSSKVSSTSASASPRTIRSSG